jgi:hypothetical protein
MGTFIVLLLFFYQRMLWWLLAEDTKSSSVTHICRNCTEENTNLEISFLLFSSVFLATKHIAREVREFLNRNSGTFIIFKFLKCVLACETLVLS